MGRASIELIFFVVCLFASSARSNRGEPCVSYGCPHRPRYEPFVPAPPGHTPRCAKPGQTFCESPDHYPQQLIKFLVDKCSYDFATVLRDENNYNFNSHRSKPDYDNGYHYRKPEVPQFYPQVLPAFTPVQQGQPAIVYGPPSNDTDHEGYNYDPPTVSPRNHFIPDAAFASSFNSQQSFRNLHDTRFLKNRRTDDLSQEQRLSSKRYSRRDERSDLAPRSRRENPFLNFADSKRIRNKRQSGNPDSVAVCPTNSQFITPRAALNNQGNWMYVVNLPETREKYSQTVQSETCVSSMCNGLCILPDGYSSRCEQKYVQKRLVALEGTGDRLYTDVFWFPHGCSCQITLNY